METRKVLEGALELLEMQGWTKGAYSRNADGEPGLGSDSGANSYCARGAIYRACIDYGAKGVTHRDALLILETALGKPIISWNDDPKTTLSEVREVFKRAIGGLAVNAEETMLVAA